MGRFEESLSDLKRAAERSPDVLVAYSGGKDSFVTADLCVRSFRRVEMFYMNLVPGLEHIEIAKDFARKQWGIQVIRDYPHFTVPKLLRAGVYCPNRYTREDMPDLKLGHIYAAAMEDTGIHMIATGAKKSDSLFRRKSWAQFEKEYLVYPLKSWSTRDVMGYLKIRKLPIPTMNLKHQTSGVDLTARDLIRIHDSFPSDFDRIEKVFPFVRAVIARRDMYGVSE